MGINIYVRGPAGNVSQSEWDPARHQGDREFWTLLVQRLPYYAENRALPPDVDQYYRPIKGMAQAWREALPKWREEQGLVDINEGRWEALTDLLERHDDYWLNLSF